MEAEMYSQAPEVTAGADSSPQMTNEYMRHFSKLVNDLSSRLDRAEELMPLCAQQVSGMSVLVQELTSLVHSTRDETKTSTEHTQLFVRDAVHKCESSIH